MYETVVAYFKQGKCCPCFIFAPFVFISSEWIQERGYLTINLCFLKLIPGCYRLLHKSMQSEVKESSGGESYGICSLKWLFRWDQRNSKDSGHCKFWVVCIKYWLEKECIIANLFYKVVHVYNHFTHREFDWQDIHRKNLLNTVKRTVIGNWKYKMM